MSIHAAAKKFWLETTDKPVEVRLIGDALMLPFRHHNTEGHPVQFTCEKVRCPACERGYDLKYLRPVPSRVWARKRRVWVDGEVVEKVVHIVGPFNPDCITWVPEEIIAREVAR